MLAVVIISVTVLGKLVSFMYITNQYQSKKRAPRVPEHLLNLKGCVEGQIFLVKSLSRTGIKVQFPEKKPKLLSENFAIETFFTDINTEYKIKKTAKKINNQNLPFNEAIFRFSKPLSQDEVSALITTTQGKYINNKFEV